MSTAPNKRRGPEKIGSLIKQRRRRRQRERQKSNRFRLAKQQLCTCIMLFCTFLCRHCTTTTWKYLISRFVEDVNTRQRLSFPFVELWYSLLEFNSRKKCQHLTKWTRNNGYKVWRCATSRYKWRFRSCRCRCCLSFLLKIKRFLAGWIQLITMPIIIISLQTFK